MFNRTPNGGEYFSFVGIKDGEKYFFCMRVQTIGPVYITCIVIDFTIITPNPVTYTNLVVYAQDTNLFDINIHMIIDPNNHTNTINDVNSFTSFIDSLGFSSEQTYMPANGWISEGGTKRQVVGVYATGEASYAVTDAGTVSEIDLNDNGAFSEYWYG